VGVPDGAPFFVGRLVLLKLSSTDGDRQFPTTKVKTMKRQQNRPTMTFCIEVSEPTSKLVVNRFTIDQHVTATPNSKRETEIYNTVQRHLSSLSIRNGFDYSIVRWGDVGPWSKDWASSGTLP
jgi:hypothetical protein